MLLWACFVGSVVEYLTWSGKVVDHLADLVQRTMHIYQVQRPPDQAQLCGDLSNVADYQTWSGRSLDQVWQCG